MQIEYFGANCVKITTKKATLVIDDTLDSLGQKSIIKPENILVYTQKDFIPKDVKAHFVVDRAGEYEVADVSVQGISARAHMDQDKQKSVTMYRLVINDIRIGVTGHIYPDITEQQLEAFGMIDILICPVGGNGYTLDGIGALKVIKKIGPKIIIPTHYADKALKYEVPPAPLEEALKAIAMEPAATEDALKIKGREFDEGTKLIVLTRQ